MDLQFHKPKTDIIHGLEAWHVWGALGWHDIRQRYRRSVIGPFWFTLSTLIMIGVLGILYSKLLGQKIDIYLPYLGIGLIVWQYLSSCLIEGTNTIINSGYLIKQIRIPLTIYIARMVWRNFIILLHSLPVIFLFLILFGHRPTIEIGFLIPSLILLWLQTIWLSIILGIVCSRYRDLIPIVSNIMQVAFFFTPVMWQPELLKDNRWIVDFNPFYHVIELVRAPMIGQPLAVTSWFWSIGLLISGFALAQYLMVRVRNRVPYWL